MKESLRKQVGAPLVLLASAAGVGIGAAYWWFVAPLWLFVAAVFLGVLSFWPRARVPALCCMTAAAFWFYAQARSTSFSPCHLKNILGDVSQTIIAEGVVAQMPTQKGKDEVDFVFEVQRVQGVDGWEKAEGSIQIFVKGELRKEVHYGDVLRWTGFVFPPEPPRNPGQFDYRSFLANRGIFYLARLDPQRVVWLREKQGSWLNRQAEKLRRHMLKASRIVPWLHGVEKIGPFRLADDNTVAALSSAMLFGDKSELPDDVLTAFRDTGTTHLFAVSGQNVAVLSGLLILLLQAAGILRWRWAWVLIPFILIFCLATGMASSATRAFIIAALVFIGWAIYRPLKPFNLLAAAALIIWIADPRQMLEVGFQLSFVIVAALLLFVRPLTHWLYQWGAPDPWIPRRFLSSRHLWMASFYYGLCGLCSVSLIAWLASQPLLLLYFHQCVFVTPLANLFIVPLANVVVIISALSAFVAWTGAALFLNQINWLLLQVIFVLVHLLANIPGGHFYLKTWPDAGTRLTLLQARAAAPAVLQSGNKAWFFTGTDSEGTWKWVVDGFRKQQGVNRWDGVVLTRAGRRRDGLKAMMAEMSAVSYAGASLPSFLKDSSSFKTTTWRAGDDFTLGPDVGIRILWPFEEGRKRGPDGNKLVFLLCIKNTRLLWAGDISSETEEAILTRANDVKADVLIQSGLSSRKNLSLPWLEKVNPSYLIYPGGENNPMDAEVRLRFEEIGIQLVDMAETGAVEIRFQKENFRLKTFLGGRVERANEFLGGPIER